MAEAQVHPAPSPAGGIFDVRFHQASRNWPGNPYHFQGPGQLVVERDFVTVRGSIPRSFRRAKREEHRVRMVDIVNVRVEATDVIFDTMVLRGTKDLAYVELGCTAPDRATAQCIAALLPDRLTEEFKVARIAYTEHETFHDRIDYWSPSTPVTWTLLTVDILIYLVMAWKRWQAPLPLHAALLGLDWVSLVNPKHLVQALVKFPQLTELPGLAPGSMVDPKRLADVQSAQFTTLGANAGRLTLHGQWWRFVTSMFLHANIIHLVLNMLGLWQVGVLVERMFGSLRFSGLYLLAGLAGGVASLALHPTGETLGASGALFGLMGGLIAFIGRENSGVPPTIAQSLRNTIGPLLLLNVLLGFSIPRIDNAAHIGGLVGGWLAGRLLARSLHVPGQRGD